MESPDVHVLDKVRWQLFGTLTFRQERLPERVRLQMFFTLVRQIAKWRRVNFHRVIWALRLESGEKTGRLHFHFLMAGLTGNINLGLCKSIEAKWRSIGGGHPLVEVYDLELDAGYILKENSLQIGGYQYETAKFSAQSCQLIISHSLSRMVKCDQSQRMRQRTRPVAGCRLGDDKCVEARNMLKPDRLAAVMA